MWILILVFNTSTAVSRLPWALLLSTGIWPASSSVSWKWVNYSQINLWNSKNINTVCYTYPNRKTFQFPRSHILHQLRCFVLRFRVRNTLLFEATIKLGDSHLCIKIGWTEILSVSQKRQYWNPSSCTYAWERNSLSKNIFVLPGLQFTLTEGIFW